MTSWNKFMTTPQNKVFYHFTCRQHWAKIKEDGLIMPTESNVGSPHAAWQPYGAHLGPDVVWLLDGPDATDADHGLLGSIYNKREVSIAVAVPAIPWLSWSPTTKMNRNWLSVMVEAGGGIEAAKRWHVWPAPIARSRWLHVEFPGSTVEGTDEHEERHAKDATNQG